VLVLQGCTTMTGFPMFSSLFHSVSAMLIVFWLKSFFLACSFLEHH
jgi:hypothetical protein